MGYDDRDRDRRRKRDEDEYHSRGHERTAHSYASSSSRHRSRSRSPPQKLSSATRSSDWRGRRERREDEEHYDRYAPRRRDERYASSHDRSSEAQRRDRCDTRNGRDWQRYEREEERDRAHRSRPWDRPPADTRSNSANAQSNVSAVVASNTAANGHSSTARDMDEKQKAKKEKLEAWRREREKKAAEEARRKEERESGQIPTSSGAPTSIKASFLTNFSLASQGPKHTKAKTVTALDDTTDAPKQLERFSLPEMDESTVSVRAAEDDDEDDETGLIEEEEEQHATREDVAATLREKREAAQALQEHSKSNVEAAGAKDKEEEAEDEVDPLDAYMAGVTDEVKQVNEADRKRSGKGRIRALAEVVGGGPMDEPGIADEDRGGDELDQAEASDILALAASKVKKKEMPTIDHAKAEYEPFRKDFYHPPAEVEEMTEEDAERLRMEMDAIKVRGKDCPNPLTKWSHCGLPGPCLEVIKKLNYTAPTAIQSQGIPAIMSGRDIIGVAKTGSGKTMAFLLPMFRHIKDQRQVEAMEGPIGLIMTPTRELAVQIFRESKPFLKALGLRAACIYGGAPISEQIAEMKKTCDFVVATPGRMIDILTANSGRVTNLLRVTYLVLDEADRMFDMGFEPQVMKIVNNIRPDRQTVLFSATFPKQMESLARKVLKNKPLEITVGGRSVVAPEIEQIVEVREESTKFNRLLEILGKTYMDDEDCRTLIFVERQESADELLKELMRKGYPTMSLHGGKDQVDRDSTISDFKAGIVPIVTATSIAARGLDVKQLKLVVNYDVPNHMEDYVHRAGRTGRAGNKGVCVTFITPEQDKYARDIIAALKASKANVPAELATLAEEFKTKVQSGKAHAAGSGFGGKGLERFESDREKTLAAQKRAFGEAGDEAAGKEAGSANASNTQKGTPAESAELRQVSDMRIEVKRGAAPDSIRDNKVKASDIDGETKEAKPKTKEEQADDDVLARNARTLEAAKANGADTTKLAAALSKIDAMIQSRKAQRAKDQEASDAERSARQRKGRDPDATDFHAIIPINDFPQRARWRVTNKETMTMLISETGASITNKGIFYEKGKEPQAGEPPKLQLLVESNDEAKVEAAVRDIKQLLLEATQAALEAEQRNPGSAPGRYSVV